MPAHLTSVKASLGFIVSVMSEKWNQNKTKSYNFKSHSHRGNGPLSFHRDGGYFLSLRKPIAFPQRIAAKLDENALNPMLEIIHSRNIQI